LPEHIETVLQKYYKKFTDEAKKSNLNETELINVAVTFRNHIDKVIKFINTTGVPDLINAYKKYKPEDFIKYDNYDAIDISVYTDIPCDYNGIMGVPITFLDKLNPEQFELLGVGSGNFAKELGIEKNYRGRTDLAYTINGKNQCPYGRVLIRKKENSK